MSLLTLNQAAELLSVSVKTVRRLAAAGDLRPVNVAPSGSARRSIRIDGRSVEEFVSRRSLGAEPARPRRRNKWAEIDAWITQTQEAAR